MVPNLLRKELTLVPMAVLAVPMERCRLCIGGYGGEVINSIPPADLSEAI